MIQSQNVTKGWLLVSSSERIMGTPYPPSVARAGIWNYWLFHAILSFNTQTQMNLQKAPAPCFRTMGRMAESSLKRCESENCTRASGETMNLAKRAKAEPTQHKPTRPTNGGTKWKNVMLVLRSNKET